MSDQSVVMGSFLDIEPSADALDDLRSLGIPDGDISVMSSLPYSPDILGRPHLKTRLPVIGLVAVVLGLLAGLFFTAITPHLYIVRVGGQPIVPLPPTLLLLYEFTMLFLIVGTFGGFLFLNHFPTDKPQYYDPKLNDGRISILVHCPAEKVAEATAVFEAHGAQDIHEPERREL
ncbi:MAG: quinol:electron acceptor oxidoreductase subunit ActD [Anaerolineae bacterium]